MNKLCCLIILSIVCGVCNAQNLVPNPSFELHDTCPDFLGQISWSLGWYVARETPDYFNVCSTNLYGGVPLNYFGYRTPSSGSAYAGIIAKGSSNTSELIGGQLLTPLQIGTKYYVSFRVSLGGQANPINYCGINKLGVLFSTVQYNINSPPPICNCAQIYTDSIVTDTLNWTRITGSFVSDSSYSYFNIGRVFTNAFTDSIQIAGTGCNAYYYVDDVCVSTDSLLCNSSVGINEIENKEEFTLFPNPFTDNINITTKTTEPVEVTLYDITSRKILNQKFTSSTTIITQQLAKGIYIYEVKNKNGVIKQGKVVKD